MPAALRLERPIVGSPLLDDLLRARLREGCAAMEIGCGPGSTPHLAAICAERGSRLYAVDVSATKLAMVQDRHSPSLRIVRSRGEDFLRRLESPVSFAYLDNYDWVDSARNASGAYPPGLSRRESELVHLEQTMLLVPRLADDALVAFDDTWFLEREPPASHGLRDPQHLSTLDSEAILREYDVFGKGSLAVPYLLSLGFRLAAFVERPASTQVLLRTAQPGEEPPSGSYPSGYFEQLLREHRLVTYPSGRGFEPARLRIAAQRVTAYLRMRVRLRTRLRALLGRA